MFPQQSILNEEQDEDNPRFAALSYASLKHILSPQPHQFKSDIIGVRSKARSDTNGLIDSQGAEVYLIKVIQNNDITEIQALLDEASHIKIHTIIDHKKYSLLHLAAYNNNLETIKLLIEHVKKQHKLNSSEILREWVNKQTDDGFAAFHFAAYRGNIQMIKELQNCGANLFLLNSQGMNGLHLAAQGDQPKSIVYFKRIGFDFLLKDSKGGTALHWASFYGCELSTNYILSLCDQLIDVIDTEGFTALHLATMSGNARIAKKLILKGANKNIRNKEGQLAADIAKENSFITIYKMLTEKQNRLLTYFSISQGFTKIERSKEKMIKFISMLLLCQIVTILYQIELQYYTLISITYQILQVIIWILLIITYKTSPGKIIPQNNDDKMKQLENLLNITDAQDICPDCICTRPKRSKHCDICGSCIQIYDHHCPWVDNCIGRDNLLAFYIFIILICLDVIYTPTLQIIYLIQLLQQTDSFQNTYYIFLFSVTTLSFLIMLLFLIPLWFLFYVQTRNLFAGKTTYERYSTSLRSMVEEEECQFTNCITMLCAKQNKNKVQTVNKQSMQLYNKQ